LNTLLTRVSDDESPRLFDGNSLKVSTPSAASHPIKDVELDPASFFEYQTNTC
jgi:hypothetical protein